MNFEQIKNSIENIFILRLIVDNLIWEFLLIVFLFLLKDLPRAFLISRDILKENRDLLGKGLGKHYADRFVDIWYTGEKNRIKKEAGTDYKNHIYRQGTRFHSDFIDKELEKKKLISIENNSSLIPVKNFRNKLIIEMIRFYLIHVIGDSKDYYKNLDDEYKKANL
jgi:hypothetical protein